MIRGWEPLGSDGASYSHHTPVDQLLSIAESIGPSPARQGSESSSCTHSAGPGKWLLHSWCCSCQGGSPAAPLLAGVWCSASHQHLKFSSRQPRLEPKLAANSLIRACEVTAFTAELGQEVLGAWPSSSGDMAPEEINNLKSFFPQRLQTRLSLQRTAQPRQVPSYRLCKISAFQMCMAFSDLLIKDCAATPRLKEARGAAKNTPNACWEIAAQVQRSGDAEA